MRTIAIEEHFLPTAIRRAAAPSPSGPAVEINLGARPATFLDRLADVGPTRLADMDASGIDVQVLSAAVVGLPSRGIAPETEVRLAREANDELADIVRAHPDRYAGLAFLPLHDPVAAAAELERSVTGLGMKGAIVNGTTDGRFLDDPVFEPVLASAARLEVPIYLHPAPPPPAVFSAYFGGLPDGVADVLSRAGWGWHVETGLHSLRLVVAGVFDRFPGLQIIIGHMGENLPFSLARANQTLTPVAGNLERPVAEYFTTNFFFTNSGYFTVPPLLCALEVVGADRLIFAIDYPFSSNEQGRAFLDAMPISPADRAKIAHGNAERLLKL